MKKIIILLFSFCLIISLVSCGEKTDSSKATNSNANLQSNNIVNPYEDVFIISTDYCDMKYPKKWEKDVYVDITPDKVSFSSADKKIKLFDLHFGGEEGYVFGTLKGNKEIELRVVSYDIDKDSDNYENYCAMQDDMNVIFQYLIEEGKLNAD